MSRGQDRRAPLNSQRAEPEGCEGAGDPGPKVTLARPPYLYCGHRHALHKPPAH